MRDKLLFKANVVQFYGLSNPEVLLDPWTLYLSHTVTGFVCVLLWNEMGLKCLRMFSSDLDSWICEKQNAFDSIQWLLR